MGCSFILERDCVIAVKSLPPLLESILNWSLSLHGGEISICPKMYIYYEIYNLNLFSNFFLQGFIISEKMSVIYYA